MAENVLLWKLTYQHFDSCLKILFLTALLDCCQQGKTFCNSHILLECLVTLIVKYLTSVFYIVVLLLLGFLYALIVQMWCTSIFNISDVLVIKCCSILYTCVLPEKYIFQCFANLLHNNQQQNSISCHCFTSLFNCLLPCSMHSLITHFFCIFGDVSNWQYYSSQWCWF